MVNFRSFHYIILEDFFIGNIFRQQWNDNRLEFNDEMGKIKYLTMTEKSKVKIDKYSWTLWIKVKLSSI